MSSPLSPTSIGHYIVERELGRGAMGVVYLASDTRLGRKVAIKALPAELALDPLRQMKFDREARTLAAVNHPNIGAIFGIEEAQGARYLVLELVEGETLAERLAYAEKSEELGVPALPIADALDICRQVAAGMAAAHERGIIHRDLKPANVKIRPDGLVKVLDFGIARGGPVEASLEPRPSPDAPTVITPTPGTDAATTHIGTIIGTPGYMSPEQARGRPVGKATDLWSFACMVYECLSGRVAFPGDNLADALASTLTMEPEYSALPRATPPRVIGLMKRCLIKDHHKRLSDFVEARVELERAIADLSSPGAPPTVLGIDPPPPDELVGWPSQTGNLPGDDTTFVGRAAEMAELARLLTSSRHITIAGPGGIGKTRLAFSAARAAESAYACGAWYVEATPASDDSLLAWRLAATIGMPLDGGDDLTGQLARFIGKRRALLVIDSCQHAKAAGAKLAAALTEACPRISLVTIGREPLGVSGETVYRLPPMTISEEAGTREGAPALLRERARVAKTTLDATADSVPAMIDLCRKLRGMPLPIELAAAWAESPTFEDVTAKLDDYLRSRNVAQIEHQAPEQIVTLLIDWAYQIVTEGERGMLRRLSIFAGGCTLRAAAAVSGAADSFPNPDVSDPSGGPLTQQEARVLDVLGRLASRSLLSVRRSADGSAANTRFLLHEPMRLLARRRLLEFTGSVSVLKRHVQYFAALADQSLPRMNGLDGAVWRARLTSELPNLVAAQETAATIGEAAMSTRLAECLKALRGG